MTESVPRGKYGPEFDVFADEPLQQPFHPSDDRIDVDRLEVDDLFAAEGEKAVREVGGPFGRAEDLLHVGAKGIVRRQLHQEQVAVADDRRQDIVEVVGDAAGELAHGLHFLRLAQLCFELLERRDVRDQPVVIDQLSLVHQSGEPAYSLSIGPSRSCAGCGVRNGIPAGRTGSCWHVPRPLRGLPRE